MLCDQCQRKQACLPLLFSQDNQKLRNMLENLKQCEMRQVNEVNYYSLIFHNFYLMFLSLNTALRNLLKFTYSNLIKGLMTLTS